LFFADRAALRGQFVFTESNKLTKIESCEIRTSVRRPREKQMVIQPLTPLAFGSRTCQTGGIVITPGNRADQELCCMGTTALNIRHDSQLALLQRAQLGDFSSFQQLIQELHPRVYSLAWRIVRQNQDAEDATQQTFLSLIENIDSFRAESLVSTWVLKIATHHSLKLLRKRNSGIPLSQFPNSTVDENYSDIPFPEFIAPWSETPEALAQQAEARREIDRALEELPEKYRVVFILRDIEGLAVRETAEVLELSESNVKVRLLRARLFLREKLTRRFGDESQQLPPPKPESTSSPDPPDRSDPIG
jgi:RNA polymerase sigma-70 factor (ECF subfamily)